LCDSYVIFFFQAEDGIRDFHVTGVQTCALPISSASIARATRIRASGEPSGPPREASKPLRSELAVRNRSQFWVMRGPICASSKRSEERRVGKECSTRWAARYWTNETLRSCTSVH